MSRLEQIRKQESLSHIRAYSEHDLFQEGSWLHKPVKTVMDLLPLFAEYPELRVLDLGCGVGRNAIPIARHFQCIPCRIDCVDILPMAIEKLNTNAQSYHVSGCIYGVVEKIECFPVQPYAYDLILAISALEHIDTEDSFICKLSEIRSGIRGNGIVCLIINSGVREFERQTGREVPAQFEVNISQSGLQTLVHKAFSGWTILKEGFRDQQYDVPREDGIHEICTSVFTFVAQKAT